MHETQLNEWLGRYDEKSAELVNAERALREGRTDENAVARLRAELVTIRADIAAIERERE